VNLFWQRRAVFLVGDGDEDLYGVFSSRAQAEAWIKRQKARGYPWALIVTVRTLDAAEDLR
jgi:hypothetical protein